MIGIGTIYFILMIVGIIILVIGFFQRSEKITNVFFVIGFAMFMVFMIVGFLYMSTVQDTWTTETEYEIWSTDAPFGYYWVHTEAEGSGCFLAFRYHLDSQLTESYTVKYLVENNQLKTMIFPSVSENHKVFLTDNKDEMTLKYFEVYEKLPLAISVVESWYEIYIPDPNLFEEMI